MVVTASSAIIILFETHLMGMVLDNFVRNIPPERQLFNKTKHCVKRPCQYERSHIRGTLELSLNRGSMMVVAIDVVHFPVLYQASVPPRLPAGSRVDSALGGVGWRGENVVGKCFREILLEH
jgi:hypothetical protein